MSNPHQYAQTIAAKIERIGLRMPTPEEWAAIVNRTLDRRLGRDRREYQARWRQTRGKQMKAGVAPLTRLAQGIG